METTYKPGDALPDGTIYLGVMNGNHVSISPKAYLGKYTWDEAMKFEKDGWFIPDRYECLMIYDFHKDNPGALEFETNYLWSARRYGNDLAYHQWLGDGSQYGSIRMGALSVRPVRRFKSFSDLIIPSPLLAEIADLEQHTGLSFPELKKALGAK